MRFHLLAPLFFVFSSLVALAAPPNILVVLTDDQGWGDLSIHGNTNLSTPHLDSIARDGASFENFYVCAVCAPTRAEFLTGRYHIRTGVSGVSRGDERMLADETTIADLFKDAGYATGAFGKWHNGTQPPLHPNFRGFDEYYGFTSGHWGHYFSPPLDHNGERVRGKGFVIDDFTDHAIDFIKANKDQPFFCYLPLNTPHSPMMVDDQYYEKFAGKDFKMKHREPRREDIMMTRAALAMCENIDWNVGRLLRTIDELRLRENTIVVYFCDNGPNSYRWNGGMKGRKGSIDEGGLRSPLFVRWPARIKPNTKISPIAGAIDLLPTLAAFADIKPATAKPLDGTSLLPLFNGEDQNWPERLLFSYRKGAVSVRSQQFRLDAKGVLFDIEADRGQTQDVSARHPKVAKRLRNAAKSHLKMMTRLRNEQSDRPFTVGYAKSTTLPARDGISHGTIERSAKAPNNSFFENWTSSDDSITWTIDVVNPGDYQVTVHYTCAAGDEGAVLKASIDNGKSVVCRVKEVFDPPLYDKSKERVSNSHYFVKDFKPIVVGTLSLEKGDQTLRLNTPEIVGGEFIDVHSIDLVRDESR